MMESLYGHHEGEELCIGTKTVFPVSNDDDALGRIAIGVNAKANKKASIDAKRNAIIEANNTIAKNESAVEDAKIKVAESEEAIKLKTKDLIVG